MHKNACKLISALDHRHPTQCIYNAQTANIPVPDTAELTLQGNLAESIS